MTRAPLRQGDDRLRPSLHNRPAWAGSPILCDWNLSPRGAVSDWVWGHTELEVTRDVLFDSLSEVPLPLLAEAIQKKHGPLAALVGCHFFELGVRKFATNRGVALVDQKGEDLDLFQCIKALAEKGKIETIKKGEWHSLRKIRNDLIHRGIVPTDHQLERLVKEALELERLNELCQA